LLSRRPTAAVCALAGAICAEIGGAPSRRCSHSRWPPSSTMAMLTAQWLRQRLGLGGGGDAAGVVRVSIGLVFMVRWSVGVKGRDHSRWRHQRQAARPAMQRTPRGGIPAGPCPP
jgi:hypothetical protein